MMKTLAAGLILSACATMPAANKSLPNQSNAAADIETLVESQTDFAVDIYKALSQKPEVNSKNIFISPLSISMAFGLAYAGARGKTANEMAAVMHYDLPDARLHPAMGQLLSKVENEQDSQIFNTANALFVENTTVLESDYSRITREHYGAGDTRVDYKNAPKSAVITINDWVSQKTRGLITETLTKDDVTRNTRNVMVNTAYLKAGWADTFPEALTKTEAFLTPSGTVQTSMMHQNSETLYMKGRGYSSVALPYQGGTMSMIAILPSKPNGLAKIEHKLSTDFVLETLTKLGMSRGKHRVDITLPKIDIKDDYKLKDDLKVMGMKTAFSNSADFSGRIDDSRQPDTYSTKLGEVIHKTVLKVDEDGTEAAAVTAINEVIVTGARRDQPKQVEFKADHPFLMLILHNETGAILFMGRINNPISKS